MIDDNLTDLLGARAADVPVGPSPLAEMHRAAVRRRRSYVAALAAAAAVVVAEVVTEPHRRGGGFVLGVSPAPGTVVEPGTVVTVTVAG